MDPGRELDYLVAEKVMGYPRIDGRLVVPIGHDSRTGEILAYDLRAEIPRFSTNISDAWKVMEKVTLLGSVFKAETPFWGCSIDTDDSIRGKSAAHAICLAALKTVG